MFKLFFFLIISNLFLIYCDKEYTNHGNLIHSSEENDEIDKNILGGSDTIKNLSKLPKEELKNKIKNHFDKIDLNKNQLVDFSELQSYINQYYINEDIKETEKRIKIFDKNNDGEVSLNEYLKNEFSVEEKYIIEKIKKAGNNNNNNNNDDGFLQLIIDDTEKFKSADIDNNNKLNLLELNSFLNPYKYKHMIKSEIKLIMKKIDKNNNGFVCFKEYLGETTPDEEQKKADYETFLSFDKNNDKLLDSKELEKWIIREDNELILRETENLIIEIDQNGDRKLNVEEVFNKYQTWISSPVTYFGGKLIRDEL